jgi:cardiolipin synthase
MEKPRTQVVAFESARGPVSAGKSAAIIEGLERTTGDSDILQRHLAIEQAINIGSPLVLGNRLVLLQDGPATYQAMFAAMRAAKDHINLETYIFEDDDIGKQFADLLLERQAAGVQVNLIYDSVGCLNTPKEFFERLRAGGIRVLEFNPVNPLAGKKKEWLLNNRDHRKLLVVDGRVAFIGGINISETYSSGSSMRSARKKGDQGWRDTHLQIEGPVVAEFQKLFMDTWNKQKGPPLAENNYFPTLDKQGDEIVRAIGSTSDDADSPIYLTLLSAIEHAEQQVHITNAYFAPDPQLLKALTDAAQRGVEVKLILPSRTDSWAVFHAGRSHYSKLLRAGVKIYERRGAVMHSKTASIDGVWSTIGSTNLDWRSFLHNDEVNAAILGRDFSRQMDAMFARDLAESDAIDLERWEQRSLILRLKEGAARIAEYWL